jgi:hypothetical protein
MENALIERTDDLTETPEQEQEQPAVRERFVIDSQSKAEWALRKGAAIDAEIALLKSQYKLRLAELEADRAAWERRFLPDLKAWAEQEKVARGRQTVTTFAGSLAFTARGEKFAITDMQTAMQTARIVCPSAITTREVEEFDKAAFMAHAQKSFAESGELLPGIDRAEPEEAFSVRFPKPGTGKEQSPDNPDVD